MTDGSLLNVCDSDRENWRLPRTSRTRGSAKPGKLLTLRFATFPRRMFCWILSDSCACVIYLLIYFPLFIQSVHTTRHQHRSVVWQAFSVTTQNGNEKLRLFCVSCGVQRFVRARSLGDTNRDRRRLGRERWNFYFDFGRNEDETRRDGTRLAPPRQQHSIPWARSLKPVRTSMGATTLAVVGGVTFLPPWFGRHQRTATELEEGRHQH